MSSASVPGITSLLHEKLGPGLELLRQMVGINSYTLNKEGVDRLGLFTAECFQPLGFAAERVPSVNPSYGDHLVLTRKGRSNRSLAMVSHLDTVFPAEEEERNHFHWQPEGDRIYGPGTQDIKGGTLMMWLVLHALKTQAPAVFEEMTWQLFWNSSEEVLSHDFGRLCRSRFDKRTVAALVFESEGRLGEDRLVVAARKGRATWQVTVEGRGAHAGGKHRSGANAIVQLAATVQQIAALTEYSRDLTFNVGLITGGSGLNRVPHEARAQGEFRAFTDEAYAAGKRAFLGLSGAGTVESIEDRHVCAIHTEILSESRPWPRNRDTDWLVTVWQKAGAQVGFPIQPQERGGLSDGNFLWDLVPTLDGLGPWGDHDHCSERSSDGSKLPEYVDVTSFIPKATVNTLAILDLLERQRQGTS